MALENASPAPDFTATVDSGENITLSELRGKWVVLYFYPKDNTPGCTKEACDFRDNMERITSIGAVVLGVSPDTKKSHDGFKEKFNLNFNLIVDNERDILESYGALGEKSMFGKKYIGVIRTTYIIDPEGIIREIYKNVKVPGHVDSVIKKLNELKKN